MEKSFAATVSSTRIEVERLRLGESSVVSCDVWGASLRLEWGASVMREDGEDRVAFPLQEGDDDARKTPRRSSLSRSLSLLWPSAAGTGNGRGDEEEEEEDSLLKTPPFSRGLEARLFFIEAFLLVSLAFKDFSSSALDVRCCLDLGGEGAPDLLVADALF